MALRWIKNLDRCLRLAAEADSRPIVAAALQDTAQTLTDLNAATARDPGDDPRLTPVSPEPDD